MCTEKISTKSVKINNDKYEYYIAIDYSQRNMAIATIRNDGNKPRVIDVDSDIDHLKAYLISLKGRKIVTIEETTSTHWLYVELFEYAEKILVCDPYRNSLLSDGPKTDKLDASNLCKLLRSGLLKEVYHSLDKKYELRQLVSEYEQLVKFGVRVKNEKSAIYRSMGKSYQKKEDIGDDTLAWIITQKDKRIDLYEKQKKEYDKMFSKKISHDTELKHLKDVTGIGTIGAVKILATVIDAKRFKNEGNYLSYCGLVKYQKMSGGRNYGQKKTRYSRRLKSVYKTAAMSVINGNSPLREYYDSLLKRGLSEENARNQLSRRIAIITYGILKTGTKYNPYKWRESK
ncbi:MAG: IS110 family transposase [Ignavibacteriae bacterium]|nr:IS110 family transposase [Ignavibacteriota bacterium]